MKIMKFLAFLVLCFSTCAVAAEKASRESMEKLLELTDAAGLVDATTAQIGQMVEGIFKDMDVAESHRQAFDGYMRKVTGLMQEDMSWEKIKEPTIDIYTRNFSEAEISGLIEFYESDVGRSVLQKMPIVMQESMEISQKMVNDAIPKLHALIAEMQAELRAAHENTEND